MKLDVEYKKLSQKEKINFNKTQKLSEIKKKLSNEMIEEEKIKKD